MDKGETWQAIDVQKARLTDLLQRLTPAEWATPSLCAGWTVRDVAAHLVVQVGPVPMLIREMVRARGNVNRMIHDSACREAQRPTDELVADLRSQVGVHRHPLGVTRLESLIDVIVHGQDIAIPLGRSLPVPADAAAVAADRVWLQRTPLHEKRTWTPSAAVFARTGDLRVFRLVATDTGWSVGAGREVRGPAVALLLALTGRPALVDELAGEGAETFAGRLPVAGA
jgi:uncharacterized protein (TIGR03083 family)